MGQYHIPVNLTKWEFFTPHFLGDGLKLIEQAYSAKTMGGTVHALHLLLSGSTGKGGGDLPKDDIVAGRWAGDRVLMVGDYAEDSDVPDHGLGFELGLVYAFASTEEDVNDWLGSLWQDEPDRAKEITEILSDKGMMTDIGPDLAHYFTENFGISYEGDGWRDRRETRDW